MSSDEQVRDFGFAPGNYIGTCLACDQEFIGDKRALRCSPCAAALRSLATKDSADVQR